MSLVVVGTGLELIRLWLNQILTIIIELSSLNTNLLGVLLDHLLVLGAVPTKGLESSRQFLSL